MVSRDWSLARRFAKAALALLGLSASVALVDLPAAARPVKATRLDLNDYQAFVGNWSPASAPTCALLRSRADWDLVIHPAAVTGFHRPFAPPDALWKTRQILLLAKVTPPSNAGQMFLAPSVTEAGGALVVDYRFVDARAGSYEVKSALMLATPVTTARRVRFVENGRTVCER